MARKDSTTRITRVTLNPGVVVRPRAAAQLDDLLRLSGERGASDLHLRVGKHPMLRIDGSITRLTQIEPLDAERLEAMVLPSMPERAQREFRELKDTDYAYELSSEWRFRANVAQERNGIAAVFRRVPGTVVTAEDLRLPPDLRALADLTRGLVIVTGPTGSGKSTTLCALVDLVNRNRAEHIITIEDPVEFVHTDQKATVMQREVGTDTRSFKAALRAALREDPNVVLIGEMRDLETVSIALETAETGHLVFASLHTTTAASTIDRIIDQFPANQQEQIRVMLAGTLRAIIAQRLCKKIGSGRVAVREVLYNTSAVANLIRERKAFQISSLMQTGRRQGMVTMNDALMELVEKRQIEPQEAYLQSGDKSALLATLRSKGYKTDFAGDRDEELILPAKR